MEGPFEYSFIILSQIIIFAPKLVIGSYNKTHKHINEQMQEGTICFYKWQHFKPLTINQWSKQIIWNPSVRIKF